MKKKKNNVVVVSTLSMTALFLAAVLVQYHRNRSVTDSLKSMKILTLPSCIGLSSKFPNKQDNCLSVTPTITVSFLHCIASLYILRFLSAFVCARNPYTT